jgi:glycosyltransferase involved in cell wall biosynthesis
MPSRLRVLFVIADLGGGGAERVLLNLVRHLDPARFLPSLFLLSRTVIYDAEIPPAVRLEWGVEAGDRIRNRSCAVLRKMTVSARNHDIVVGALELLPSYFAYAAAVAAGKPTVAWVHSDLRWHLPIYGQERTHRLMIRALYPRFKKVVFPTQNARQGLEAFARVDAAACQVISNPSDIAMTVGRSAEPIPPPADRVYAKPTILGAGALRNAIKGFDILLEAHAIARSRGCDHNLVILGEGPDRAKLEQMAQRLGVAGSTFLPGFQANPYPFFRAAVAVVVPSRFEAFGMVVTEAMTLGVPVLVASSALGALEVVEHGRHGRVFPAENAAALAAEICEMIASPSLREDYSRRGLARAQFYATPRIVAEWETLLWQLASTTAGEPSGVRRA